MALPNFFVVGAMKAGTTAIAAALARHPDVHVCPVKEPNHFCSDLHAEGFFNRGASVRELDSSRSAYFRKRPLTRLHNALVTDGRAYEELFREWQGQKAVGEFSTSYLFSRSAAREIGARLPDARIVAVLRNPLERAVSEYLMNRSIGTTSAAFEAEVEKELAQISGGGLPRIGTYVTAGLYADQVARYVEVFGRDRVLLLLHSDLEREFTRTLQRICGFLGVDDRIDLGRTSENSATEPRFARLNALLMKSGVKSWLKSHVPPGAKALAKRYYYRPPDSDRRAIAAPVQESLAALFNGDLERLGSEAGLDVSSLLVTAPTPGPRDLMAEGGLATQGPPA